jgi:uncharacterized DUF497 family protein
MEFEFDPKKSEANREKHGIDFDKAKALWLDEFALERPARSENEVRRMLIAVHGGKLWAAIFTERENKIRIISIRRAHNNEEALYEKRKNDSGKS